MQIQVPMGMTYNQYTQTPQGQREMQAMQNWFGGGQSGGASAMPASPQLSGQALGGASLDYGQLGNGAVQPTQPGRMYSPGMAQPMPPRSQGTAYNSGSRPIAQTKLYRPIVTEQPTTSYPKYPTPPKNPNDAAGIKAWTNFYGSAPVFEKMPGPRQTPYDFQPRAPQTTVTTSPGAGRGRGDTRPRQQTMTWGGMSPGAYGTDDDAEYFVGSASDPASEAWNAQQQQQAEKQRSQNLRAVQQFNQMRPAAPAASTPFRPAPRVPRR